MMFLMHIALSIGLIAFLGALSLFIWGLRNEGPGKEIAKFFGLIIAILIVIDFVCVGYYALNYWREGYFATPTSMMPNKSMGGGMMDGGMMEQKK